jgi:hypothetical protein
MNTEMSDFVKLVLERMDTFPEEFMRDGVNYRWATLVNGIVDLVMGDTESSGARSLWALEPHELEAITTKYKAIYLENQKRAFLKNILIGDEPKSKKVNVVPRSSSALTTELITQHAMNILEDQLTMTSKSNIVGASLGHSNNTNAYEYGQRHLREPNK